MYPLIRRLVVAAFVSSLPSLAFAHAHLDHAAPPVGQTVATAPTEVRLWFTQKLEPSFSRVQVTDAGGQRVDRDDSRVDPADAQQMVISLQPLPPGTYTVAWRAVSVDTHTTEGKHVFHVGAQTSQAAPIQVQDAWARPSPGAVKTGAAYLTLINTGAADDRLVSASTPVAGKAEVHVTTDDNGIMKMRPAGAVEVKPGTPTKFQPGGLHVMLTDLKAPLTEGQNFPLTLVFEKAGAVQTTVHVQRTPPAGSAGGAMGPMNMDHGAMDHGAMHGGGSMNMGH